MANAHRICQAMDIKLQGKAKRYLHPGGQGLRPRETYAGKTIRTVAETGERWDLPEHIYDVLGLITSSKPNDRYLYGDVIQAVSMWALSYRVTTEEMPFLSEPFSSIDLSALRQVAGRVPVRPKSITLAVQISGMMGKPLEALRT